MILHFLQQTYDLFVGKSKDDLAQWRIKIEVR